MWIKESEQGKMRKPSKGNIKSYNSLPSTRGNLWQDMIQRVELLHTDDTVGWSPHDLFLGVFAHSLWLFLSDNLCSWLLQHPVVSTELLPSLPSLMPCPLWNTLPDLEGLPLKSGRELPRLHDLQPVGQKNEHNTGDTKVCV